MGADPLSLKETKSLIARLLAVHETPDDLTEEEVQHVYEDAEAWIAAAEEKNDG